MQSYQNAPIWLLVFHLICASLSFSQGYYPLETGNRWDYGYLEFQPGEPTHFVYQRTVTLQGDTLMSNGNRYAVLSGGGFLRQHGDTVYEYVSQGEEAIYYFTPKDHDTLTIYVAQDTVRTIIGRGADTVFGKLRTVWGFSWQASNSSMYTVSRVVDSIGYAYGESEGGLNEYLLGAVINGNVYGTVTGGPLGRELPPMEFSLQQNYPNPFNPSTTIRYALPHSSHVTLSVFNTLGQQVAELVNGEIKAGYHEIHFDARNRATGVYFYRLTAGNFIQTRKMILVK